MSWLFLLKANILFDMIKIILMFCFGGFMGRDIVIYVGLIYSYLANNKKYLEKDEAINFVKVVKDNLKEMYSEWEIVFDSEIIERLLYLGVVKDNNGKYILLPSSKLDVCYNSLPLDIVTATLKENALEVIGVDKNLLEVESGYVKRNDVINVYCMEEKAARENVKKSLTLNGCKNIKISSSVLKYLNNDIGYCVSYDCDRPFERVNVLVKKI